MSKQRTPKRRPVMNASGFLELLEDMEKKVQSERILSGKIEGPFYSRAIFSCRVRMGLRKASGKAGCEIRD